MEITITLTPAELATFVDCTPGVYNKLRPEVQQLVSEMRDTQLYYSAENKIVAATAAAFTAQAMATPTFRPVGERLGVDTEPTTACKRYGCHKNPTHGHCNRCLSA